MFAKDANWFILCRAFRGRSSHGPLRLAVAQDSRHARDTQRRRKMSHKIAFAG